MECLNPQCRGDCTAVGRQSVRDADGAVLREKLVLRCSACGRLFLRSWDEEALAVATDRAVADAAAGMDGQGPAAPEPTGGVAGLLVVEAPPPEERTAENWSK